MITGTSCIKHPNSTTNDEQSDQAKFVNQRNKSKQTALIIGTPCIKHPNSNKKIPTNQVTPITQLDINNEQQIKQTKIEKPRINQYGGGGRGRNASVPYLTQRGLPGEKLVRVEHSRCKLEPKKKTKENGR